MAATLRKVYSILFPKTLHFSHRKPSLAFVTLSVNCIHTSGRITTNFEEDNAEEKDIYSVSKLHLTEEEIIQCPIRRFTGNIYVINPSNEHDLEILRALNRLKTEDALGFDAEMSEERSLHSTMGNKTTKVVQIASQTDAVVWQLKHFKSLPLSLVHFLKSDILKVGHSISGDAILLKKEFNINSRSLFDTLPWAIQLNCKPRGLLGLCAIFLGWRISKGLQTSNWNRNELSENQINYACTDAWAGLMLYNKMKRFALENGRECPSSISSVGDILETILESRRNRRSRLIRNNKAARNFNRLVETASKLVE